MLFVVDVFLAGTAFVLAQALRVTIGFTFSCGLIDFLVFGVLQGNSKTHWIFIVIFGLEDQLRIDQKNNPFSFY